MKLKEDHATSRLDSWRGNVVSRSRVYNVNDVYVIKCSLLPVLVQVRSHQSLSSLELTRRRKPRISCTSSSTPRSAHQRYTQSLPFHEPRQRLPFERRGRILDGLDERSKPRPRDMAVFCGEVYRRGNVVALFRHCAPDLEDEHDGLVRGVDQAAV